MSAHLLRPPDTAAIPAVALSDGLAASQTDLNTQPLATLPIGAHLIVRCRKDWRDATVVAISHERVTLSVGTAKGRTYRLRRPPDALVRLDGPIPVLGEGAWRAGMVRYDTRW